MLILTSFSAAGACGPLPQPSEPAGPAVVEQAHRYDAIVVFRPARAVVLGRSGGYTTLASVDTLVGALAGQRGDTLALLVREARGATPGRSYTIPLGATTTIVHDGGTLVTLVPWEASLARTRSGQSSGMVFLAALAGAFVGVYLLILSLSG